MMRSRGNRTHGQTRLQRKLEEQATAFLEKAKEDKRKAKLRQRQRKDPTRRDTQQYARWRMRVLRRDKFECLRCHSKKHLQVHHCMVSYAKNKARRLDVVNGATLCVFCHAYEHPWMIEKLEKEMDPDMVAFEMAQREYAWGLIQNKNERKRTKQAGPILNPARPPPA